MTSQKFEFTSENIFSSDGRKLMQKIPQNKWVRASLKNGDVEVKAHIWEEDTFRRFYINTRPSYTTKWTIDPQTLGYVSLRKDRDYGGDFYDFIKALNTLSKLSNVSGD